MQSAGFILQLKHSLPAKNGGTSAIRDGMVMIFINGIFINFYAILKSSGTEILASCSFYTMIFIPLF